MAELRIGQRVRIRPELGDPQEGYVYTHDAATGTLVIKQDVAHTTTTCELRVFNREGIEVEVLEDGDGMKDDIAQHPGISERDLEKKEKKAHADAHKAWAQINRNATPEGQLIFDALVKTMGCEWEGETIVVFGQVKVFPPYTPATCKSMDGSQEALQRVTHVLEGERRRLAKELAALEQQRR